MIALMVQSETFSNNQTLIELLRRPGTQEAATHILEAASRAICTLVNESALRSGVPVENVFDSRLTLTMLFQMPTAEDFFNPDIHVEVNRL